ncbi:MAG: GNAT family N-acetyltransferase [Planctomycetota bacterium]|nr:GNAT family N-acetyltransferase [Planctomycetota bacterium]
MKFILETARLRLREMTPADLDFMASMLADPEVMRFYPKCLSREEARAWIEKILGKYQEDGHSFWLVLKKESGELIGQVGLLKQTVREVFETEVGYMLHRPFWRRGYGSEAAWGVRDLAFRTKKSRRVISLIRPENKPSRGVARKLGFEAESELVSHHGLDHLVYSMTRTKWQEQPGYGLVE